MNTVPPQFGLGVYTLADVARYVGMSPSTCRAWFKPARGTREKVLYSDYAPVGSDFAVSFLDLIDTLRVRELRREGVRMPVIRRSYKILADKLDTPHPFAHSQLYTDGRGVFVSAVDEIGDTTLENVISRQGFFANMKAWLKQISFDPHTQLASQWRVAEGIVIDPKRGYGRPTIEGTSTSTSVIANFYRANDRNAALVAELYDIREESVLAAVRYEDQLSQNRAA